MLSLAGGGVAGWLGCGTSGSTSAATHDAGGTLTASDGGGESTCTPDNSGCTSTPGTGTGTGTGTGSHVGTGSGSGSSAGGDAGEGNLGITGGTVNRLYFASTGDTRPSLPAISLDETLDYPTAIIDEIFSDIEALTPRPSFVVTSGDYQYAAEASASVAQIDLYLGARAKFAGPVFYAMGNHECSPIGLTSSNCGAGNADGLSSNYTTFLSTMMAPLQQTLPYYVINIDSTDGSWTSKFVFVAANAWDTTQQSWLTTAMAAKTTYTFVIRHEPNDSNTAPGVTPSEAIISTYPITLEICGHVHDYSHTGNRVVLGNGGAPLTGSGDYGFGVFQQREDGAIVVDEIDYQTGAADPSFHFVVTPTGQITM
jgi:hypothetical protein